MKSMRVFGVAAATVLMAGLSSAVVGRAEGGQQDDARKAKVDRELAMVIADGNEGPGQEAQQKVMLQLMSVDAQVVKGKRYSAATSTETVQTLTDGNRITHRTESKFYRDAEGRTRREETFGNIDPEHPTPHEVKVFIDDPVSGTAYVLDPGEKTARKVDRSPTFISDRNSSSDAPKVMFNVSINNNDEGPEHAVKIRDERALDMKKIDLQIVDDKRDVVKEDLGARNIEGVDCNGTRQTITIPAGEIGNERPISIVTETWFAPSINAVVQSATDDPRYGKTTYQLTDLKTSEPSRGLFEAPGDYKLEGRK